MFGRLLAVRLTECVTIVSVLPIRVRGPTDTKFVEKHSHRKIPEFRYLRASESSGFQMEFWLPRALGAPKN